MYDADSYEQDVRGLYLSPEELPGPITKTEQELVDAIHRQECEFPYRDKQLEFNQKFNPYEDGNSGKRVIDMCLRALPHKRTLYERFVRYTKKRSTECAFYGCYCVIMFSDFPLSRNVP